MKSKKALVDKSYLLEKFSGKGGWTYARIPEILQNKHTPFGWVTVKGSIDNFELKNYKLMPMGNGQLFLPVRAEIRKKIGKQAGDYVHITLFEDNTGVTIPEELLACLEQEPKALATFTKLSQGQQKEYIDWIYSAKTDAKKVERIAECLNRLTQGKAFRD